MEEKHDLKPCTDKWYRVKIYEEHFLSLLPFGLLSFTHLSKAKKNLYALPFAYAVIPALVMMTEFGVERLHLNAALIL